jgi:hypothetical protein
MISDNWKTQPESKQAGTRCPEMDTDAIVTIWGATVAALSEIDDRLGDLAAAVATSGALDRIIRADRVKELQRRVHECATLALNCAPRQLNLPCI